MKTDAEIKQFIDNLDVLTKTELSRFMCGRWVGGNRRLNSWWDYVMKTKNWSKLKSYQKSRINTARQKYDFEHIKKIINNDLRFKNVGFKIWKRLFNKVYSIPISKSTTRILYHKIRGSNA